MKKIFIYFVFILSISQANAQCWSKIASGSQHTLAIKSDGTLWAWGYNYYGQLGDGTTVDKFIPTQIGTDNNWQSVAVGYLHSVALKTDATLWTWGYNDKGQLGDGTIIDKTIPTQVGTDTNWRSIDAGNSFCVAINGLGTSTTLWTWGENQFGQLGIGSTNNSLIPLQVGTSSNWKSVSAGNFHVVALQNVFGGNGKLFAWGFNGYGQLGDNTTNNQSTPIQIGTDITWNSITAGALHNLARKNNGTLWAWGMNFYGQIGDGSVVNVYFPTQIMADTNWSSVISAGYGHSMAKKTNGTLWIWGANGNGQLGMGNTTQLQTPQQMGTDTNWGNAIGTGDYYSVAIKFDGTLYTWGYGASGQLANDTSNISSSIPIAISCPTTLSTNNNLLKQNEFIIFPNPSTNGEFSIQSKIEIKEMTVFDILGKEIYIEKNNNLYKTNAPTGIYTLKIVDVEGNIQNKKLIIN